MFLIRGINGYMAEKERLLTVENLTTEFELRDKKLVAVNDVSLHIDRGEIVGLVGESGCGKSMTAFSILGIVPFPGKTIRGRVVFKKRDLLKYNQKEMRSVRGKNISLVYQDPLSSLNPSYTIYWHLSEVMRAHGKRMNRKSEEKEIIEALRRVGIPEPETKVNQFPHQFSGGMRQRVVIAMALILDPLLIIADEPTTALDVTTQKAIFNLIEKLKEDLNLSFTVISHDLYLIGERCDRIYVMYSGQIVEHGASHEIFDNPLHPYTKGLISAIPLIGSEKEKLGVIKGEVQNLIELPGGCFFAGRCEFAEEKCRRNRQDLKALRGNRLVRCWKVDNV